MGNYLEEAEKKKEQFDLKKKQHIHDFEELVVRLYQVRKWIKAPLYRFRFFKERCPICKSKVTKESVKSFHYYTLHRCTSKSCEWEYGVIDWNHSEDWN